MNERERTGERPSDASFSLAAALEALLFTSDRPLTTAELQAVLECSEEEIAAALEAMAEHYTQARHALRIRRTHGGYELVVARPWRPLLMKFREHRDRRKLSPAVLETLAVIAYHQPITVQEISSMRGVDASYACRKLIELNLIRVVGRKPAPGRPRMFGTTPAFLDLLGIRSVDDLPPWEAFLEDKEIRASWDEET